MALSLSCPNHQHPGKEVKVMSARNWTGSSMASVTGFTGCCPPQRTCNLGGTFTFCSHATAQALRTESRSPTARVSAAAGPGHVPKSPMQQCSREVIRRLGCALLTASRAVGSSEAIPQRAHVKGVNSTMQLGFCSGITLCVTMLGFFTSLLKVLLLRQLVRKLLKHVVGQTKSTASSR